jgi:hypothetical protein
MSKVQNPIYTVPTFFPAIKVFSQFGRKPFTMGNSCKTGSQIHLSKSEIMVEARDMLIGLDGIHDSLVFYQTAMRLLAQLDYALGDLPDNFQEVICLKMDQIQKTRLDRKQMASERTEDCTGIKVETITEGVKVVRKNMFNQEGELEPHTTFISKSSGPLYQDVVVVGNPATWSIENAREKQMALDLEVDRIQGMKTEVVEEGYVAVEIRNEPEHQCEVEETKEEIIEVSPEVTLYFGEVLNEFKTQFCVLWFRLFILRDLKKFFKGQDPCKIICTKDKLKVQIIARNFKERNIVSLVLPSIIAELRSNNIQLELSEFSPSPVPNEECKYDEGANSNAPDLTLCLLRSGNRLDWKEPIKFLKPLVGSGCQGKIAVIAMRRTESKDTPMNQKHYEIQDSSFKKTLKGTGAGKLLLTFNEKRIHETDLTKSTLNAVIQQYILPLAYQ